MRKKVSLLLVLCFGVFVSFAQTVTGKVSDDEGNGIAGASVLERGSKNGVTSDNSGNFSITLKKAGSSLIISATGYETKVVPSGDAANVVLATEVKALDQVVVTGVAQATSKKKLSFSLTTVKGSDINIVPQLDASQSLRGRVAGVQINQSQGNQGATVFLRGAKSIFGFVEPLIVVDGFQTNLRLSDINPEDIENIEVVKGAAAASLYGTRAEGGVIQIVTKKGKSSRGAPSIVVDAEYGQNDVLRTPELSNNHIFQVNSTGDFLFSSPNQRIINYESNGFSLKLSPYKNVYDNTKALLDGRPFSSYLVSIGNASGPFNYYVSFQNQSRGGLVKPVAADVRNTFKVNVGYKPYKDIETNITLQYIDNSRPSDFTSANNQGTLFAATLQYEPFINLLETNADGTYKAKPTGFEIQNANLYNPLYEWSQRKITAKSSNTLMGADFRWRFAKGFDVFVSGAVNRENIARTNYYPQGYLTVTPNATLNNGFYSEERSEVYFNNFNAQLNYNTKINKDFEVGGSLKFIYEDYGRSGFGASGYNLTAPVQDLSVTDPTTRNQSSSYAKTINKGYFVNGRAGWKDKIFLDVLARIDQSSRYGKDVQNAVFPRASVAYRITEDVKLGKLNELKVRAAWGRAGSLPGYNWKNSRASVSATGISFTQLENTNLERSFTDELEIGLEGQAFNRINFNLTYAKADSKNGIMLAPSLVVTNGSAAIYKNLAAVTSTSYEAEINGDIIKNSSFTWNQGFTFGLTRSKITDLSGSPDFSDFDYTNPESSNSPIFRKSIGLSAFGFWGEKVVRNLNDLTFDGSGVVNNVIVMNGTTPLTGLTKNDFVVNKMGYVVIKSTENTANERPLKLRDASTGNTFFMQRGEPDFQMGFPVNLKYKDFNLFFMVDWKKGGYKYNTTVQYLTFNNRTKLFEDFARSGLPLQFVQALYNGNSVTDVFLEKSSFAALREVSLAYNLSGRKLGKVGKTISNIRFAAIGRNLLYLTNYGGVNPEGYYEYYPYPVYRTITAKVTVNLF
jgi:TonB-linked SusC/RagA family outer membrane protein